jgi:hypothetical protein
MQHGYNFDVVAVHAVHHAFQMAKIWPARFIDLVAMFMAR